MYHYFMTAYITLCTKNCELCAWESKECKREDIHGVKCINHLDASKKILFNH